MAKNPRQPKSPNKKHLARLERERLQTRNIFIVSGVVLTLVFLLILYGILDQTVLRARQPVAIVNGESITTKEFQGQARYSRYSLVSNAQQTFQFMQFFGSDPNTQASFFSQLQQIQMQLAPSAVGQATLDQMVDDRLIRQEAVRRGITVSAEELEAAFQEAFGFYPDGTPTPSPTAEPMPTSTLSPLQLTLTAPTATPAATETLTATSALTATEDVETAAATETAAAEEALSPTPTGVLTPTATAAPSPTPTPYTLEGYQKLYQETVDDFQKNYDISEADLRFVIESQLYREKVMEAVLAEMEIGQTQEQVWARHILVQDEQNATDIRERLDQGDSFCALAAEFSADESNKANCGDLGWFGRGRMVTEFENVAWELEVGEISQPAQTTNGWHIIQVLGHEDRPLTSDEFEQQRAEKFQEWLNEQNEASEVEIRDYWTERVPAEPTLPAEIEAAIAQAQQQQAAPILPELPEGTEPPAEAPAATAEP